MNPTVMANLIARQVKEWDAKPFFKGTTTKNPTMVIVINYEKVCLKS